MNIPPLQRVVEDLVEKFTAGEEVTVGLLSKRCKYVLLRIDLNPKRAIGRLIKLGILHDIGKKKHRWVLLEDCMAIYYARVNSKGFDQSILFTGEEKEC